MPRCRDYFCVFDPCLVFWTTVIAVLEFVNFILLIVCISMTDSVQDFSDSCLGSDSPMRLDLSSGTELVRLTTGQKQLTGQVA